MSDNKCQSEKQKLIDICFACSIAINNHAAVNGPQTNRQVAEWVALQLRDCGFETKPLGMSWGVLK